MQSRDAGPRQPLTKEQDELRLRGLRSRARLSARAHRAAGRGVGAARTGPQAEPPRKEDRHAG
ncbi:MAG: hypothetical protein F4152_05810 [Dehalococcoidia bacterium]|nr:hypothetical protein [Dehalococcoidia bacterium]